ncbi:DUF6086 family protein [Streptomyces sp. NPDC057403]|uniref:DUF6086 family protein n=1 Tax=Streptomyces sp. NPDC057403 TaxID=3346119 RepID=UPI00368FCF89
MDGAHTGFTATTLALAERAGIPVGWALLGAPPEGPLADVQVSSPTGLPAPPAGETWASRLRQKARDLARSMPR